MQRPALLGTSLPSGPPAGKASDREVGAGGKQERPGGTPPGALPDNGPFT